MLSSLRNPWLGSIGRGLKQLLGRSNGHPAAPPARASGNTGEVIACVHRAGGRVFLAHPLDWQKNLQNLGESLPALIAQGLDGLEAWYKPYPLEQQQALAKLAAQHDLLVSAGSDFHGGFLHMGITPGHQIPETDFAQFMQAVG